jgi:predicted dehydrogenase
MTQNVRVGLVSTSWWAEEMLLPSLLSHPQVQVAAICGRDRSRAEVVAGKYGIPAVYTDYRALCESGRLDAVIVAAPDDAHYAITMQALDAGLHVLCEKPLAADAAQARAMADRAASAGVKHMVMYTFRWMPQLQYVRTLIDEGYLGRLYHCEFRYLMGYARSRDYMWRLDRRRANGLLGDIGSHMIDTARWLVGEITAVSAQLGFHVERSSADGGLADHVNAANDSALLLVQFANGGQGVIQASGVAHLADSALKQQVRLYGADGTLEIDVPPFGPATAAVIRGARQDEAQMQVLDVPPAYWGAADPVNPFTVFTTNSAGARRFIDVILHDEPATPNFYDGYKAQQVIDAALASHASGCAVAIPA